MSTEFISHSEDNIPLTNSDKNIKESEEKEKNKANTRNSIPWEERKLPRVTIKQIQQAEAPEPMQNLKIDSEDVVNICIMGQIQSIQQERDFRLLIVNDYTGNLDVKVWNQKEENENKKEILRYI